MTKSVLFFICVLSFSASAQTVNETVVYSLYLIGDAGEPDILNSTVGEVLREQTKNSVANSTVLFLGDNVYPKGLPDPSHKNRKEAERILQTQVEWIRATGAKGIFLPGNHDWFRGRRQGWQQITNQQQWIDSLSEKQITLLPRDGCPGPVEVPIGNNALLVILDTQWFLHPGNKPKEESSCDATTPAEALLLLNDIFVRNASKRIILAAHHPLITYGEHGGVFTMKDHLFPLTSVKPKLYIPLPVVGSLYPLYRKWFGDIQDTSHPTYKEMIGGISSLLEQYPGTIYAAGHEHALQAIKKDSVYYVVSGAAVKTTFVKEKKYTRFAASKTGFVKADIFENGQVKFTYFQIDAEFPKGRIVFSDSLPALKRLQIDPFQEGQIDFSNKMVKVKASDQYSASRSKERFLGENYRAAWQQDIEVPVFDLKNQNGGMKVLQKGGGMQTLSLRLEDS